MSISYAELKVILDDRFTQFNSALEASLSSAMQKALDTVVTDLEDRLRQIEEDQARIMRHLGLGE